MFRFLCILPRYFPQKNRKDCHLSATFVEKYRCVKTCEILRCKAENDNKKRRKIRRFARFPPLFIHRRNRSRCHPDGTPG